MRAPQPPNEAARLEALRQYDILDTGPEEMFDAITALAAQLFGTPIALVTLVDMHRQWFKAKVGLQATETPRDIAFCAHAIQHPTPLVVPDTLQDTRFQTNPLVTNDPHIRFYAGAPLLTPEGHALGTLCIIDRQPRALRPEEIERLQALARLVVLHLEFRRAVADLARVIFWQLTPAGLYTYVSPSSRPLLGYAPADLLGSRAWELVPPEDRPIVQQALTAVVHDPAPSTVTHRVCRQDGQTIWVETISQAVRDAETGAVLEIRAASRDVTARKEAEEALQATQTRLQQLLASSPVVIYALTIEHDQFRPLWVSEHITPMMGYPARDTLQPTWWEEQLHPEDRAQAQADSALVLTQDHVVHGYRLRHADGTYRWIRDEKCLLRDAAGTPVEVFGAWADDTARQEAEARIAYLAYHEALTGLPNRTQLLKRLQDLLQTAGTRAQPVAVFVMNLDRFGEINSTLGHDTGDRLLQQVGQRLREVSPDGTLVAHLGGDEFAVVVSECDAESAAHVVRTLHDGLARPFAVAQLALEVRASIGIAVFPGQGTDPTTLLRHADVAMRQAKAAHSGSARYAAHRDPYNPRRLTLVGQLGAAIAEEQLVLHYQPKLALPTHRITGMEALVRWPHPALGMIAPGEFIALAESTGVIHALTRWVLRESLRQAYGHAWGDHALTLAVNVSARNLQDSRFPEYLHQQLETWGLPPQLLRLEITESAVMADPEDALQLLRRLRDGGLSLSLDDFGTGYSSLAYLKALPVQEVKLDQSFVRNLQGQERDVAIVRSLIQLSHDLGLTVVAEGVEDRDTLERLAELGCDVVQGYYISRPLPASEFTTWLTSFPTGQRLA